MCGLVDGPFFSITGVSKGPLSMGKQRRERLVCVMERVLKYGER